MKKNIALILFYVGLLSHINPAENFSKLDGVEEEKSRNPFYDRFSSVCNAVKSTFASEAVAPSGRSLYSRMDAVREFLELNNRILNELRHVEEYSALEDSLIEIQNIFNGVGGSYDTFLNFEQNLKPIVEGQTEKTKEKLKKLEDLVHDGLDHIDPKMDALTTAINSAIEKSRRK